MRQLIFLSALFLVGIVVATTPRNETQITNLPGLEFTPNFQQYSGYITLEGTTKNIFYWFVTSQNNPSTDPVVLWMQGGPGCSDLGGGTFLENGPYFPTVTDWTTNQVNLTSNPYSWNKIANVIYIDQPCGVGFSYGEQPSDYETNDNQTAIDNYLFLQGFFDVYSEFSTNTFWITGESYAGIYITTLAYQVLNNGSDPQLAANLKKGGVMLGNPVTRCAGESYTGKGDILELDTKVNIYYWHGMASRRDYDNWNSNSCNIEQPPSLEKCYEIFITIESGIGHLDQPTKALFTQLENSRLASRRAEIEVSKPKKLQPTASVDPDMLYFSFCVGNGTLDFDVAAVPGCFTLDEQIDTYLNYPDVQEALHAKPTKWEECGGVLYHQNSGSVIPYLENFFSVAPTMTILYYSGDCDFATVPFPQTQRCLATLNRPVKEAWRPYTINREVSGYVEVYDTYTYATIKGAGHEAPQYQPAAGYLLFSTFLNGGSLPR